MTEDNKEQGEVKEVYLPIGRAATYLGVSWLTIKKYVEKGRLQVAMKDPVGRDYYAQSDLDAIKPEIVANRKKYQPWNTQGKESEE